jgi:hypothetical protein
MSTAHQLVKAAQLEHGPTFLEPLLPASAQAALLEHSLPLLERLHQMCASTVLLVPFRMSLVHLLRAPALPALLVLILPMVPLCA